MNKLPPEMDSLMWALAESGNDDAVLEFGQRYPEHRTELLRRISMVKGLKQERKHTSVAERAVPAFVPTPQPRTASTGTRIAVGALVFASLAFASYTVVANLDSKQKAEPKPIAPIVKTEPVKVEPIKYRPAPSGNVQPAPVTKRETLETRPKVKNEEPAYLRPKDVRIPETLLTQALTLITDGSGIKLTFAPGFVDQQVSVDYTAKSTVEILDDMAQKYGFSAVDEGSGNYLIIPAPSSNSKGTENTSTRRVGG